MKHALRFLGIATCSLVASVLIFGGTASAFSPNRIIDDSIFDNADTMRSSDIDRFLNTFSSSCISQNNGFSAPDPVGYSPSSGFSYGGNVSAGMVIAHAAQAYGINPQVLLVTLQKEQSLVSGTAGCSTLRYAAAVGYGCPDSGTTYSYSGVNLYTRNGTTVTSVSGTCVNSSVKAGFSQQVIRAAWLLKFGERRSEGDIHWAVIKTTNYDNAGYPWNSNWDNSDDPQTCYGGPMTQGNYATCPSGSTVYYDGYYTIDGQSIHIDTGPTAALYWYTPHFNGNQNFQNLFESWFGPTTSSGFNWQYVSQAQYTDSSKTTTVDPNNLMGGQRYYLTLTAKNTGTQTWQRGIVNLGTTWSYNRSSAFCDNTWLSCNRAATLDQSSVAPGSTGTFSFWVTTPPNGGDFKETFDLVADGYAWMTDLGQHWQFHVTPRQYDWQYLGQNAYTDSNKTSVADLNNVTPGQRYYLTLSVKNVGNMTWNQGSYNLATSLGNNRSSAFHDSTWLSNNRAARLDQTSVAPGQTGTFSFWVTAPSAPGSGGTYREHFRPVVDGVTWPPDYYGVYWQFGVPNPDYNWQDVGQNAYTDTSKNTTVDLGNVTKGQRVYLTAQLKNTGNIVWNSGVLNLGTAAPYNRSSAFHDSTWLSSNRAVSVPSTVLPGQTATVGFWVTAPNTAGTYKEYFDPVADGLSWLVDYGMYYQFTVH